MLNLTLIRRLLVLTLMSAIFASSANTRTTSAAQDQAIEDSKDEEDVADRRDNRHHFDQRETFSVARLAVHG